MKDHPHSDDNRLLRLWSRPGRWVAAVVGTIFLAQLATLDLRKGLFRPFGLPIVTLVPILLAFDRGLLARSNSPARSRQRMVAVGGMVAIASLVLRIAMAGSVSRSILLVLAGTALAFAVGVSVPLSLKRALQPRRRVGPQWLTLATVSVVSVAIWAIVGRRLGAVGLVPLLVGLVGGVAGLAILARDLLDKNR